MPGFSLKDVCVNFGSKRDLSDVCIPNKRGNTKSQRKNFGDKVIRETCDNQGGECFSCDEKVSPKTGHAHHRDNDPSNNDPSNCAMLCPKCHDRISRVNRKPRDDNFD
jgi:5-methylcytosine-specific restriction endonuclease McrA